MLAPAVPSAFWGVDVRVTVAVPDGTSVSSSRISVDEASSGGATACSTIDIRTPVRSTCCQMKLLLGWTKSKCTFCSVSPEATTAANCGLDGPAALVNWNSVQ